MLSRPLPAAKIVVLPESIDVRRRRLTRHRIKKILLTVESAYPPLSWVKAGLRSHILRALGRPHEPEFRILALIPPRLHGCYVDVGANKGQSIESILLFKPMAEVISFEPNIILAKQLTSRYKNRTNVHIIAQGLAHSIGSFPLFIPRYRQLLLPDLASLNREAARTWVTGERVFAFDSSKLEIIESSCQVSTLDLHHLTPIFIKIDVQGGEYNVLTGARDTLAQCEPVLSIEDFRGDTRSVRLLDELGYEEYAFVGSTLQKAQTAGDNSLLLTPRRARDLGSQLFHMRVVGPGPRVRRRWRLTSSEFVHEASWRHHTDLVQPTR
jgi:FkbM family methyltransferase